MRREARTGTLLAALAALAVGALHVAVSGYEHQPYHACDLHSDCDAHSFCAVKCFTENCPMEDGYTNYCQPCNFCFTEYDGWEYGPSDCRRPCNEGGAKTPTTESGEYYTLLLLGTEEFATDVRHGVEYLASTYIEGLEAGMEVRAGSAAECANICMDHRFGSNIGSSPCRAFSYGLDSQVCHLKLHPEGDAFVTDSSYVSGKLLLTAENNHILLQRFNEYSRHWLMQRWSLKTFFATALPGEFDEGVLDDVDIPGMDTA